MKYTLIKSLIVGFFFLGCATANAQMRVGNHTVYFEDRHGNEVEVNYKGSYQYDNSKKKWLPLAGSYNFSGKCTSLYSCNTGFQSSQIAEDFVSAIDAHAFYTWVFEEEPPFCKPGEVCQQPKKGNASRQPASKETSVSQEILNWSQAFKNGADIFKQFSSDESKDKSNFLIYKKNGQIHDLCMPTGNTCQSVMDIEHADERSIEARVTYIRSTSTGQSLSDFLDEMLESGKVFSSCQITTTCSTLSDGSTRCTSSFSCFY